MSKDGYIEKNGVVEKTLPGGEFTVKITDQEGKGAMIHAILSGKMRKHYIRIQVGDKVKLDISLYNPSKGRITYREKINRQPSQ